MNKQLSDFLESNPHTDANEYQEQIDKGLPSPEAWGCKPLAFEVDEHRLYVRTAKGVDTYNRDIYDWYRDKSTVRIDLRSGHLDKVIVLEGV